MEALLQAKTKLVTDYLMLAQQMNHTANSMTNYVSALAALPSHSDTVQHLVPIPQLPPAEPFNQYLNELKGIQGGASSSTTGPKAKTLKTEEGGEGEGKKRGRKSTGTKKEKDPNAPKRPASAYIIFQNELRPKLRQANPDMPYKDVLTKISEEWKAVPEDKKHEYNEQARLAMDEWRKDNAAYQASKDGGAVATPATPATPDEEDEEEEPPAKKHKAEESDSDSSENDQESSDSSSEDDKPAPPPVKATSSSKKTAAAATTSPKKSKKQK